MRSIRTVLAAMAVGMVGLSPTVDAARAVDPATRGCIGNPPRQTEDPLSPPCIMHWEGDNGGATWKGVTGAEIRVAAYLPHAIDGLAPGTVLDLAAPPAVAEPATLDALRAWEAYFSTRYELYGRRLRLLVFTASGTGIHHAIADAIWVDTVAHPFAVAYLGDGGHADAFAGHLGDRGTLVFGRFPGLDESALPADAADRVWSVLPTARQMEERAAAAVCRSMAGRPAGFMGPLGKNGAARKFGLVLTTSTTSGLDRRAQAIQEALHACGVSPAVIVSYRADQVARPDVALAIATEMQSAEVTTIFWAGPHEPTISVAAARQAYQPEWVLVGDGVTDANGPTRLHEPTTWSSARTITAEPLVPVRVGERDCAIAYRHANPGASDRHIADHACPAYPALRLAATALQLAGPLLTPDAVTTGLRSFSVAGDGRNVPACSFADDTTCIDDVALGRWTPASLGIDGEPVNGCWRLTGDAVRRTADEWSGDLGALSAVPGPCTGFEGTTGVRAAAVALPR